MMSDLTDEQWHRIVVEVLRRAMGRLYAKMSDCNEDLLPDIQAVIGWLDKGASEPPPEFRMLGKAFNQSPTNWGSYLSSECAMMMAAPETTVASMNQVRDNEYAQQKLDIDELLNAVEAS